MRRYTLVSGALLSLLAALQLIRVLMRWPVTVAGVDLPLWPSVFAILVTGSLAAWAFRLASARADVG